MSYGIQIKNTNSDVLIDGNNSTYPVLAVGDFNMLLDTGSQYGYGVYSGTFQDDIWATAECSAHPRFPITTQQLHLKPEGLPNSVFGSITLVDDIKMHGGFYKNHNSQYFIIDDGTNAFPWKWGSHENAYGDPLLRFKVIFFAPASTTQAHSDGYGLDLYNGSGAMTFNGSLPQLKLAAVFDNIILGESESALLNLPIPLDNPPVIFITETDRSSSWAALSIRKAALMVDNKYTQIRVGAWYAPVDFMSYSDSKVTIRVDVFTF